MASTGSELRLPPPTRTLEDLHTFGGPATISDKHGTVEVWLQKLTDVEAGMVERKAAGARAAALTVKEDERSEEWMESLGELVTLLGEQILLSEEALRAQELEGVDDTDGPAQSPEERTKRALASQIVERQMVEIRVSVDAQLRDDTDDESNKWAKDGYIDGLREAWDAGLDRVYAAWPEPADEEPPEAVEARRVLDEMTKFVEEVQERERSEREDLISQHLHKDVARLRREAVAAFIENQADIVWSNTAMRWRVYYSTRRPDNHNLRYFRGVKVPEDWDGVGLYVDRVEQETLAELLMQYQALVISDAEGKDWRSAPDSSDSSSSPDEEGTSGSAGPQGSDATPT